MPVCGPNLKISQYLNLDPLKEFKLSQKIISLEFYEYIF